MSLAARCGHIVTSTQGLLTWGYDERLECASAVFTSDVKVRVRAAMDASFESVWSSKTIDDAPAAVQAIAERLGLRRGQGLFVTPTGPDPLLAGAWWPWGDGKTISIRVLLVGTPTAADRVVYLGAFGLQ